MIPIICSVHAQKSNQTQGAIIRDLVRFIHALQDIMYWSARDISYPSDYNNQALANAFALKDGVWERLPYDVRNSIKAGKGRFKVEAE